MLKCITFYGVSSARFILANSRVVGWLGLMFAFLWQRHHPHNQHHHHPQRPIFVVIIIVQCSFYCGEVLLASTATPASLPPAAPQNIQKQKKRKKQWLKKKRIQCAPAKANKTLSFGEALRFHRLALNVWVVCMYLGDEEACQHTHTHTHTRTWVLPCFSLLFFCQLPTFPLISCFYFFFAVCHCPANTYVCL